MNVKNTFTLIDEIIDTHNYQEMERMKQNHSHEKSFMTNRNKNNTTFHSSIRMQSSLMAKSPEGIEDGDEVASNEEEE